MKYLFTLLSLLPLPAFAQKKLTWHLAYETGIIANQINFSGLDPSMYTYNSENINFWGGLKTWADYKHLQLGVAVETGLIKERIGYRTLVYNNNVLVGEQERSGTYAIFSPAVSPTVFAHYKLTMPRGNYMYVGPAAGVIAGRNDLENKNMVAFTGGLNLGIALKISKAAHFELAHSYRAAKVNVDNSLRTNTQNLPQGSYNTYVIQDFWLQYVSTGIGLVVNF